MTDTSTAIDIQALQDFHATLATRLDQVDAVITKMAGDLAGKPLALGAFGEADATAAGLDELRRQYAARLDRLRSAIVAAQTATGTIIANYRTTEQRNSVNAGDIGNQLGGITVALRDGGTDG